MILCAGVSHALHRPAQPDRTLSFAPCRHECRAAVRLDLKPSPGRRRRRQRGRRCGYWTASGPWRPAALVWPPRAPDRFAVRSCAAFQPPDPTQTRRRPAHLRRLPIMWIRGQVARLPTSIIRESSFTSGSVSKRNQSSARVLGSCARTRAPSERECVGAHNVDLREAYQSRTLD
jgi:hypothetical protein